MLSPIVKNSFTLIISFSIHSMGVTSEAMIRSAVVAPLEKLIGYTIMAPNPMLKKNGTAETVAMTCLRPSPGIRQEFLYMTPVTTMVSTDRGELPFQHYFVRHQCEPVVSGFAFEGISAARPNREVMQRLQRGEFAAVVICPSNPYVSVDPILQVPGLWLALRNNPAPVVLVSPIVAGQAIKGPAAKMMDELGAGASALEVARHYCVRYPRLVDYFVIDSSDATLAPAIGDLGITAVQTTTIMKERADKRALAAFCLQLAGVQAP